MDASPDAEQPEILGMDVLRSQPKEFTRIVGSAGALEGIRMGLGILHMTTIEHIDGVYQKAGILILVGDGEEELHTINVQPRLLLHLANHPFLARLKHVGEAAWEVEGALGGILGTTHTKPFKTLSPCRSLYQGNGGGGGIEIVGKPTRLAVLGLGVVLHEARRTALGTEMELMKGMHNELFCNFVDEVVCVAPAVDEPKDIADIDTDAAGEVAVEADVAGKGIPVAVEGEADEFALAVEHG